MRQKPKRPGGTSRGKDKQRSDFPQIRWMGVCMVFVRDGRSQANGSNERDRRGRKDDDGDGGGRE